jgi:hypothetical protein
MKNDIKKDNSLLPLCHQDTKKENDLRAKTSHYLLVVLCLLVVADLLLLIIVVINSSRTNTEGSPLSKSQQGLGIRDRWVDRDVWELKERLILLAVNDLLVGLNNLQMLLHDIHALIRVLA